MSVIKDSYVVPVSIFNCGKVRPKDKTNKVFVLELL